MPAVAKFRFNRAPARTILMNVFVTPRSSRRRRPQPTRSIVAANASQEIVRAQTELRLQETARGELLTSNPNTVSSLFSQPQATKGLKLNVVA
jgi:hypothetical protein